MFVTACYLIKHTQCEKKMQRYCVKRRVSKHVHIYKRSENRYPDIILIPNHKPDVWITLLLNSKKVTKLQ